MCPDNLELLKFVEYNNVPLATDRIYNSFVELDQHVTGYHYPWLWNLLCPLCKEADDKAKKEEAAKSKTAKGPSRRRGPPLSFVWREDCEHHWRTKHPRRKIIYDFHVSDMKEWRLAESPMFNRGFIPPRMPLNVHSVSGKYNRPTGCIDVGPWSFCVALLLSLPVNYCPGKFGSAYDQSAKRGQPRDERSYAEVLRYSPPEAEPGRQPKLRLTGFHSRRIQKRPNAP